MDLVGKGALVTGGSRGIGRAIVQRLAADGARVVFNFARSVDHAAEVVQAVRDAGGCAHGVRVNLGCSGAVDELMSVAERYLDGLDILVNNAALGFTPTVMVDTDETVYDAVMAVNTRSTFLTMRYAARCMRNNGRIINISSLNTTRPAPGTAVYAASKGAIEQLTKVAAIELGRRGITVNAVCPGATDTDLLRRTNTPEALDQVARLTALGRLGQPKDIAEVVALLVNPNSHWLTGQIIHATGGLS